MNILFNFRNRILAAIIVCVLIVSCTTGVSNTDKKQQDYDTISQAKLETKDSITKKKIRVYKKCIGGLCKVEL